MTTVPDGITLDQINAAKEAALEEVLVFSGELETHRFVGEDALNGYEATFPAFLDRLTKARRANATFGEIAKALRADEPGNGQPKRHLYSSEGAISSLEPLMLLRELDGDLPDGWVWRPEKDGVIVLKDGQESITRLVLRIVNPGETATAVLKEWADANGVDRPYGKAVAMRALHAKTGKAEAVATLQATLKAMLDLVAQQAKSKKDAEKQPKTAEQHVKAAIRLLEKAQDALDEGNQGDLRELADALRTVKVMAASTLAGVPAA